MYIRSILIAALVSGAYASENPFAVEKNVQKIEQEENSLFQSLAKEQNRLGAEEDEALEENASVVETPQAKPEENPAPSKQNVTEQSKVQEIKKEIEVNTTMQPASTPKNVPETTKIQETKKEVNESVAPEATPPVAHVDLKPEPKEAPKEMTAKEIAPPAEKVVEKPETGDTKAKNMTPHIEKVIEKSEEPEAKESMSVQSPQPVEMQIEAIDAKIKELEKKLKASKADIAAVNGEASPAQEAEPAADEAAERQTKMDVSADNNSTFNQELREAIKSVQD